MIFVEITVAIAIIGQLGPDEPIAIRCTGTERIEIAGKPTTASRRFATTLILNEHDRTVANWNEEFGREMPLCLPQMRGCTVDFAPAVITIDTEPVGANFMAATIDRRTGRYWSFVSYLQSTSTIEANCTKVDMPRFDTNKRVF